MKKKIFILFAILAVSLVGVFINLKTYAASNDCIKVTDNIEYFKASLFDYNNIEFNESARNMKQSDFNALSIEQKNKVDSQHTLIGNSGYMWDSWHGKNASLYGGMQNATILKDGEAVAYGYNSSIFKGIVKDKLVNDNIILNYNNENNTIFFPTYQEAEAQGRVGNGKIYQEILRNYKVPFIKQNSGYYYMDSNLYHWKRNNNSFDLHKGMIGGLSEWNTRMIGLFPFNKECYTDSNTSQRNNLYYGMRIDIDFYMTEDGKTYNSENKKLEDIVFEFTGDDDVWVFIDDNLILDMGGASGIIAKGNINFAKNQTYTNNVINSDLKIIPDVYENNVFGDNILSKGEHKLKVFYLERFGGTSNFKMQFNLPKKEETTTYSGTKEWRDDNDSQNLRPKNYSLKLYANGEYLKTKTFAATDTDWLFDGLAKVDRSTNKEILYTVQEDEIVLKNGDKYVPTIDKNKVINTLTGTTTMEAQKIWEDNENANKTRPDNIIFIIKRKIGGVK